MPCSIVAWIAALPRASASTWRTTFSYASSGSASCRYIARATRSVVSRAWADSSDIASSCWSATPGRQTTGEESVPASHPASRARRVNLPLQDRVRSALFSSAAARFPAMSASDRHIRARHLPAARGRQQRQPAAPVARSAERAPDARNVIEFRNVCMHYPAGDIGLDGATFNVRRGEFLFIVGSTGSGKSTIMRLLIKEREPTSGTISVAGRSLHELEHNKVPYYRRNIGVVFQDFKLLPNRTVYDNVAYALSATGARRKEIRAKVPDVLRLTGLSTKLHNYPDQLS